MLEPWIRSCSSREKASLGTRTDILSKTALSGQRYQSECPLHNTLSKQQRSISNWLFWLTMFPHRSKFSMDAYKKAKAEKYQFLLVDCFPTTDEELRLRQSLFPDDRGINWVFVPE
ncbi:uncharacterized protein NPIL_431741 [Nephila pilipes]|uniref:Uncharacterized protein n=1 Tax=Nephila pilipes TaxID=299642 RepID=A0A8X6QN50_NEPPI|nr:uncharacterized protein NPIL_431741 [Nephila pilipes]